MNNKVKKAANALLSMQRHSWEQGVTAHAFIDLGEKDMVISLALSAVYRQRNDGRLAVMGVNHATTDPCASGESIVYAYEHTGEQIYKDALDKVLNWSLNDIPKTDDGVVYHVDDKSIVMADSTYMLPPFLVSAGYYQEAVKQMDGFWKYLYNEDKGLLHHIWNTEKQAFEREMFWGGGNGWALAGIARMLKTIPTEDLRENLIEKFTKLLDSCLVYMREDGLFHDVLDDSTSFVETNFGQMCAYAIFTAVKSGWLNSKYIEVAEKMRKVANLKVDDLGFVQDVASMPGFHKAGISPEGQAFYILMEVSAEEYYK